MSRMKIICCILATFSIVAGLLVVSPPEKTLAQTTSQTIVLTAIADASVKSDNPTRNYGRTSTMATDGSPLKVNYVKFDLSPLSGKNIISARLHLKVATDPSPQIQSNKHVENNTWDEYQITYNNRPAAGNQVLASINSGGVTDAWQEVDITGAVRVSAGQVISLAIEMDGTNGITFYTRETVDKPQIIVEYSDAQLPTPTPVFSATATLPPAPSSTPGSGNGTAVLAAIADASVKSDNPTRNYGRTSTMATDGSPLKINYLKFDLSPLSGKNIVSARLHIKVATDPSPQVQSIKNVADTSWDEYQITYNNRPAIGGDVLASINSHSFTDAWQEVDITGAVRTSAGQVISLAIDMDGTNGITFYTREAVDKPQIIVSSLNIQTRKVQRQHQFSRLRQPRRPLLQPLRQWSSETIQSSQQLGISPAIPAQPRLHPPATSRSLRI